MSSKQSLLLTNVKLNSNQPSCILPSQLSPLPRQQFRNSKSHPGTTLEKSTLFPELAAELRFRIWKPAYPEPSMISIIVIPFTLEWEAECATKSSSLLAVSHESRKEMLRTHLIIRGTAVRTPVLFDGAKDTLVFQRSPVQKWHDTRCVDSRKFLRWY
ncbi:hypothetical protein WAI453_001893 [Rhynchosporium graminicola]